MDWPQENALTDRGAVPAASRCPGGAVDPPADAVSLRLAILERAAEIAGIGSSGRNPDTHEVWWSDNLLRLFGLSPGDPVPAPGYFFDRIHADDRSRVRRTVAAAAKTGGTEEVEFRLARADGLVRRMRAIVAPADGDPRQPGSNRFLGTVQDVTERRQLAREVEGHIAMQEVLASWVSLNEDGARLLASLGEAKNLAVGLLWLCENQVLEARFRWLSDALGRTEFEAAPRALVDGTRQSLPVAAWLTRQPVVVVNLPDAPPFPGRDAAVAAGLRGALAIPAVSGGRVFAVLEFYSRESLQPTETLMRSLTGMGHELGHFFGGRTGELHPQELTPRELEILTLAARGMTVKASAQILSVSASTVRTHFENVYRKWGISDRASAVAKALREGLIQ
jgi:PAS domain S-box-containing protein